MYTDSTGRGAAAAERFHALFAHLAADLDRDLDVLSGALDAMAQHRLLGLRVPERWGGGALGPLGFWLFSEGAAHTSGALAFLQV